MALNAFFILAYNVYNYLFIQLAIMPKRFQKMSLNMQIHNPKLYYFIAFQNISLLQALPYCLGKEASKFWNIGFSFVMIIFMAVIYLIHVKVFNYNNIINNIISFIGNFCFSSLILELILIKESFFLITNFSGNISI